MHLGGLHDVLMEKQALNRLKKQLVQGLISHEKAAPFLKSTEQYMAGIQAGSRARIKPKSDKFPAGLGISVRFDPKSPRTFAEGGMISPGRKKITLGTDWYHDPASPGWKPELVQTLRHEVNEHAVPLMYPGIEGKQGRMGVTFGSHRNPKVLTREAVDVGLDPNPAVREAFKKYRSIRATMGVVPVYRTEAQAWREARIRTTPFEDLPKNRHGAVAVRHPSINWPSLPSRGREKFLAELSTLTLRMPRETRRALQPRLAEKQRVIKASQTPGWRAKARARLRAATQPQSLEG